MKKVIFGSALVIGGILLTAQSMFFLEEINSLETPHLIRTFPVIGIALFISGMILGIKGIREKD